MGRNAASGLAKTRGIGDASATCGSKLLARGFWRDRARRGKDSVACGSAANGARCRERIVGDITPRTTLRQQREAATPRTTPRQQREAATPRQQREATTRG